MELALSISVIINICMIGFILKSFFVQKKNDLIKDLHDRIQNSMISYSRLLHYLDDIEEGNYVYKPSVLKLIESINNNKIDYNLLSQIEQEIHKSKVSLRIWDRDEKEIVEGAYYYVSRKKGSPKTFKTGETN